MNTDNLSFTLDQLIYASQIMFPADYQRLLEKHSDYDANFIKYMVGQYKYSYKSNLFLLIKEMSRAYPKDLEILTKILKDLIGNYGIDIAK